MRNLLPLEPHLHNHFAGSRASANILRLEAEQALADGDEVVFDFQGIHATQSFVDELIGSLILKNGPRILEMIVFKGCSDDVKAIIEFVAADRCDQFSKACNPH